jgi:hypothetical protein
MDKKRLQYAHGKNKINYMESAIVENIVRMVTEINLIERKKNIHLHALMIEIRETVNGLNEELSGGFATNVKLSTGKAYNSYTKRICYHFKCDYFNKEGEWLYGTIQFDHMFY